ncbi:MAG: UDP-N-acetylmuramoyl-L-alanine--D-glutamate ligase, partial [Eggerthellaceae bacterium]|nr:UDP-N-acetylmuramoyl-L-alanine--D-glutamate ligase [Eggerthellaceae bacterium]
MAELLENRDFAPANLGRVLLLGAGKSSLASLEYLVDLALDRVQEIVIAAGPKTDSVEEVLGELEAKSCGKLKIFFDREDVHDTVFGESFDLCIVSPGISEFS